MESTVNPTQLLIGIFFSLISIISFFSFGVQPSYFNTLLINVGIIISKATDFYALVLLPFLISSIFLSKSNLGIVTGEHIMLFFTRTIAGKLTPSETRKGAMIIKLIPVVIAFLIILFALEPLTERNYRLAVNELGVAYILSFTIVLLQGFEVPELLVVPKSGYHSASRSGLLPTKELIAYIYIGDSFIKVAEDIHWIQIKQDDLYFIFNRNDTGYEFTTDSIKQGELILKVDLGVRLNPDITFPESLDRKQIEQFNRLLNLETGFLKDIVTQAVRIRTSQFANLSLNLLTIHLPATSTSDNPYGRIHAHMIKVLSFIHLEFERIRDEIIKEISKKIDDKLNIEETLFEVVKIDFINLNNIDEIVNRLLQQISSLNEEFAKKKIEVDDTILKGKVSILHDILQSMASNTFSIDELHQTLDSLFGNSFRSKATTSERPADAFNVAMEVENVEDYEDVEIYARISNVLIDADIPQAEFAGNRLILFLSTKLREDKEVSSFFVQQQLSIDSFIKNLTDTGNIFETSPKQVRDWIRKIVLGNRHAA